MPNQLADQTAQSIQGKRSKRLTLIMLAGLLLATTSAIAWEVHFEDQFTVKRWASVEPGLYRSSEMSDAMCEYTLAKHGIETIISLGADTTGDPDKLPEQTASAKLNIDRTAINMRGDGTGTVDSYVQAVTLLTEARRAGKVTLVHCGSGVNRTGGVLACYKTLVQGESATTAMQHMKDYDFSSHKNAKLLPFLNQIMPELATRLKEEGIIDHIPDPIPQLVE